VAVAGRAGARLDVLTVDPPLIDGAASASPGKRHQAERHLAMDTLVARAIDGGGIDSRSETNLVVGDPADALTAASENLDLLMIGSHGYGRPRLPLTGGVVHRVLSGARCPVVVVPGGAAGLALSALPEPGVASRRRRSR
jgi:nucleotide-binding universal stress UspA family protein